MTGRIAGNHNHRIRTSAPPVFRRPAHLGIARSASLRIRDQTLAVPKHGRGSVSGRAEGSAKREAAASVDLLAPECALDLAACRFGLRRSWVSAGRQRPPAAGRFCRSLRWPPCQKTPPGGCRIAAAEPAQVSPGRGTVSVGRASGRAAGLAGPRRRGSARARRDPAPTTRRRSPSLCSDRWPPPRCLRNIPPPA